MCGWRPLSVSSRGRLQCVSASWPLPFLWGHQSAWIGAPAALLYLGHFRKDPPPGTVTLRPRGRDSACGSGDTVEPTTLSVSPSTFRKEVTLRC